MQAQSQPARCGAMPSALLRAPRAAAPLRRERKLRVLSAAPSIQLATAKLPKAVDVPAFGSNMYQWASSLTSSGANMPFILPFMVDKVGDGFKLSLINISESGRPESVGDIVASVESREEDKILFVRFYEGKGFANEYGKGRKALPTDDNERLKLALSCLQDVPVIMRTMPTAIRRAVAVSQ